MSKLNNITFYILVFTLISANVILFSRTLSLYITSMTKSPIPKNQYSILIDLEEKKLYLLNNGKLYKKYPCAIGAPSTPSPIGSFKINRKEKWGEGFGGYWMGINCTWGNYGIHGTTMPSSIGSEASHGCFRMYNKDAEELYNIVPVGTVVSVIGGCYGAFGKGFRVITPYMYGRDVQVVQQRLKKLGYYDSFCDGIYESEYFKLAVHKFQRDHGLPISDNIDMKTLNALGFVMMD